MRLAFVMRKRLALSLVVSLLAAVPHAYSQSTTDPYSQTQGQSQGTDCSDPASAMSSACNSDLNQSSLGLGSYGQLGSGERNVPSGSPLSTRTYTDLGIGGSSSSTNQRTNLQQIATVLPPEPLTEFQKFVAGTTGEVLPIFGADLFRTVPSTFAPVDQIPVTSEYVIGAGDALRIRVWGQINFNADVRVDRTGSIYLPRWGTFMSPACPFPSLISTCARRLGVYTGILILLSM